MGARQEARGAFWPGWRNSCIVTKDDLKQLRKQVNRHIRVFAMEEDIVHWDVVNEPFDNHDILDILGSVDWFQGGSRCTAFREALTSTAMESCQAAVGIRPTVITMREPLMLLENGAPLDRIGMQAHFDKLLIGLSDDILAFLDRCAKYGLSIWATEYDLRVDDEEVCGMFTRDFYTALFSHPSVEGVVMWGFWDGAHWKDDGVMYRKDWSLKTSGEAV